MRSRCIADHPDHRIRQDSLNRNQPQLEYQRQGLRWESRQRVRLSENCLRRMCRFRDLLGLGSLREKSKSSTNVQ